MAKRKMTKEEEGVLLLKMIKGNAIWIIKSIEQFKKGKLAPKDVRRTVLRESASIRDNIHRIMARELLE